MSSKYSINELAIGHSFPLKLRFMIDRIQAPQNATLKKLTQIFFNRVNSDQNTGYSREKQNQNPLKSVQNFKKTPQPRAKRVVSHKHQRSQIKKTPPKQDLFLDLLHITSQNKTLRQNSFKPYRLQKSYQKHIKTESSPRNLKVDHRRSEFNRRGKTNTTCKNESWKVEKWQTQLQSVMTGSFLMKINLRE